ncbi:protein of unknown function [Humidesulfovibrio mexicanus]|uniref:DUF2703 domain-containing protein n=1 Tax=Humidesulfovibrio mexicanus TaxID=147047 RepID=A0A239ASP2_9BACT|nr:DUF2703 domain-containing protein [Humidesulfovibrio mexicanus]SNR98361.1 protein of unknown function [Humidesulfovibrio mexicanus]
MRLEIVWQRLTVGGGTCERCGDTGRSVREAAAELDRQLAPRGIAVRLEEKAVAPFAVAESNRVFLNGRALEDILGAEVLMNGCPSCGELLGAATDCRALRLEGRVYEALPAEFIVRAGLAEAERILAGR